VCGIPAVNDIIRIYCVWAPGFQSLGYGASVGDVSRLAVWRHYNAIRLQKNAENKSIGSADPI